MLLIWRWMAGASCCAGGVSRLSDFIDGVLWSFHLERKRAGGATALVVDGIDHDKIITGGFRGIEDGGFSGWVGDRSGDGFGFPDFGIQDPSHEVDCVLIGVLRSEGQFHGFTGCSQS